MQLSWSVDKSAGSARLVARDALERTYTVIGYANHLTLVISEPGEPQDGQVARRSVDLPTNTSIRHQTTQLARLTAQRFLDAGEDGDQQVRLARALDDAYALFRHNYRR